MLLEEAFFGQLAEDHEVAAIVGDRIFPVEIPQFEPGVVTYPCVVYRLVSRPGLYTLDGVTNCAESTMEVFCLAKEYIAAKTLARAVRRSLDTVEPTDPLAALEADKLGILKLGEVDTKEIDDIEELDVFNIIQTWQLRHVED